MVSKNKIWFCIIILVLFLCSNCKKTIDLNSFYKNDIDTIITKVRYNFENYKSKIPIFNRNELEHFDKLIKISVKVLYAPENINKELFEKIIGEFSIDYNNTKLFDFYTEQYNGDYILKKDITHDEIEIITNLLNYSKYPKRKSYLEELDPYLLTTNELFIHDWDAYYFSIFDNEKYRAKTLKHSITIIKTIEYSQRKVKLLFGKLYLNNLLKNEIKKNIDTITILITEEVNEYTLKFLIMFSQEY